MGKFTSEMKRPESSAAAEVINTINTGKDTKYRPKAAGDEEAARRRAEGTTQGRKGAEMTRVSLTLTAPNYDYIRVMAKSVGKAMNKYINYIIEQHREQNKELYDDLKAVYIKHGLLEGLEE